MKDIELELVNHCEHESCDLGQVWYECPLCDGQNITCDNWYELTDYGNRPNEIDLTCEHCKKVFKTHYEDGDWFYKGDL